MRAVYIRTHPFVLTFAIASVAVGLAALLVPEARSASIALSQLPDWIALLWAAMSIVGGGFCAYGIWTLSPRFEGAGAAMLAGTQLFQMVTSIAAIGWSPALLGTILRVGLALGLIIRAVVIARLP